MAFKIIQKVENTPPIWCAMDGSSTYYLNQLVSVVAPSAAAVTGAIKPLSVPAGAADTTNKQVMYGVVVGFNDNPGTFNTTGQYSTGVTTKAAQLARVYAGAEGMYKKGDPQPLVQVELIFPTTLLRGNIYNAALGTAPTVISDTVGTDSTGYTSAGTTTAADVALVASLGTIYCRTGANAGIYRSTLNTSASAPQVTVAFPYNVALADTFVMVPYKQGFSQVYINGTGTGAGAGGLFLDCSNNGSSNSFIVNIVSLNLTTAGSEYADFYFGADHFCFARA
jgi:hypothetical protein